LRLTLLSCSLLCTLSTQTTSSATLGTPSVEHKASRKVDERNMLVSGSTKPTAIGQCSDLPNFTLKADWPLAKDQAEGVGSSISYHEAATLMRHHLELQLSQSVTNGLF
jgi:hypothetical protein